MAVILAAVGAVQAPSVSLACSTGSIAGKVMGFDGQPVVAATVVVIGSRLGAYCDDEGYF